jgi:mono/diheme cytochrome c family protein
MRIAMDECSAVTRERHQLSHISGVSGFAAVAILLLSPGSVFAQDTSFGQRLFQDKADCQFCHGIDGDGRGDPRSPGQAANLHKTILNREQLVEVIACGRPGTEMPHFDKFAYEDKSCYGRTAAELGADTPHYPHSTSLTKREIEAIADYLFAKFVGK